MHSIDGREFVDVQDCMASISIQDECILMDSIWTRESGMLFYIIFVLRSLQKSIPRKKSH